MLAIPFSRKALSVTVGAALIFSLYITSWHVWAGQLSAITYTLSSHTTSSPANHTIVFQSTNGVGSGQRVKLTLSNLLSDTGSISYQDVDLSYGATLATLGSTASAGVWGVSVDSSQKNITFTYPTSGGTPIATGTTITIKIGTHATYQSTGTQQLVNASSGGGKSLWISAGSDVSLLSIGITSASGTVQSPNQAVPLIVAPTPVPTPTPTPTPTPAPSPTPAPTQEEAQKQQSTQESDAPQKQPEQKPAPIVQEKAETKPSPTPSAEEEKNEKKEEAKEQQQPPPEEQTADQTTQNSLSQKNDVASGATPQNEKKEVFETPQVISNIVESAQAVTAKLSDVTGSTIDTFTANVNSFVETITQESLVSDDFSMLQQDPVLTPREEARAIRLAPPVAAEGAGGIRAQRSDGAGLIISNSSNSAAYELSVKNITPTQAEGWAHVVFPSDKRIAPAQVYIVAAQDRNGQAVSSFDNAPSFTFTFTNEELGGIDPGQLAIYSWNPALLAFQREPSVVDTAARTVTSRIPHLSIFALFGENEAVQEEKDESLVPVIPSVELSPVVSSIYGNDVQMIQQDGEPITITGGQFYSTPQSAISLCIPKTIFKKAIKSMHFSIGKQSFPFVYDKKRSCYEAIITTPENTGKQSVVIRIIYGDDQIQTIRLKAVITGALQAKVLSTIAPAVKTVERTAVIANTEVKKTVVATQPALQTTVVVATPIVAAANPAIILNTMNWYHYANHAMSVIFTLLGLRRRRKQWGVVYDAISKRPIDLAIVRLIDAETKKLVETQVTDKEGRFSFLATRGAYNLDVSKASFHFPSSIVSGTTDGEFLSVYHGEKLAIKDDDDTMSVNIPLDRPDTRNTHLSPLTYLKKIFQEQSSLLLGGSASISVLLAIYTPSSVNTMFMIVQVVCVIGNITATTTKERPWGVVFNTISKAPVALAAISIFSAGEKKLLRTRLTDYEGRFSFLIPAGSYSIRAAQDHFIFPPVKPMPKKVYTGQVLKIKKGGLIKMNVPLEPLEDTAKKSPSRSA